jgi:hypothetical protein
MRWMTPSTAQTRIMMKINPSLTLVLLATLFSLFSCVNEDSKVDSVKKTSSSPEKNERTTANHMPLLKEWTLPYGTVTHHKEGKNPELKKGQKMYAKVDSVQEGTPFLAYVRGMKDSSFTARTPYYIELMERNKFGNVGRGAVEVRNGNIEGAPISVELHTYNGNTRRDTCSGYKCKVLVNWEGTD